VDDVYLGDGVYASFDGMHVILDLRKQDNSKIALEASVVVEFMKFIHKCGYDLDKLVAICRDD